MKIFTHADQETPVLLPSGAERRVLSYGNPLMLVEFRFPAGITLPEHSHPHEQVGYVVSGEVDFVIEGEPTTRLGAGGSYYVPAGRKHYVVIIAPSVMLDCFTPAREDFLER